MEISTPDADLKIMAGGESLSAFFKGVAHIGANKSVDIPVTGFVRFDDPMYGVLVDIRTEQVYHNQKKILELAHGAVSNCFRNVSLDIVKQEYIKARHEYLENNQREAAHRFEEAKKALRDFKEKHGL